MFLRGALNTPLFGGKMKKSTVLFALVMSAGLLLSEVVWSQNRAFPMGPDPRVTPGSVCSRPSAYRYPARVPYCNRSVTHDLKMKVVQVYQRQLGYTINLQNRAAFKIDHLIPLCAGGSNQEDNLWPQHESIFKRTDPIEPLVCDLMAKNRLSQKDAIRLVFTAKNDLSRVPEVMSILTRLSR